MKKIGNILWGIVFIIIGVIIGLNALDITHINIFFSGWWTLFIIIPCFIDLFNDKDKTGDIIGIIVGIILLLCAQNILSFAIVWKLAIPTILIVLGISIIFKSILDFHLLCLQMAVTSNILDYNIISSCFLLFNKIFRIEKNSWIFIYSLFNMDYFCNLFKYRCLYTKLIGIFIR